MPPPPVSTAQLSIQNTLIERHDRRGVGLCLSTAMHTEASGIGMWRPHSLCRRSLRCWSCPARCLKGAEKIVEKRPSLPMGSPRARFSPNATIRAHRGIPAVQHLRSRPDCEGLISLGSSAREGYGSGIASSCDSGYDDHLHLRRRRVTRPTCSQGFSCLLILCRRQETSQLEPPENPGYYSHDEYIPGTSTKYRGLS